MKLLACILLFCLAATAFGQFNRCRMISEKINRTRRVCQRSCTPVGARLRIICRVVGAGQTVLRCPLNCCFIGNTCHRIQNT